MSHFDYMLRCWLTKYGAGGRQIGIGIFRFTETLEFQEIKSWSARETIVHLLLDSKRAA